MAKTGPLSGFRAAARLGRAVLRGLRRPPRMHTVSFPGDPELVGALRKDVSGLSQVIDAARTGDTGRARTLLTTHFRERQAPRFFLDPTEVRWLAERFAAARPDWRAEAITSVADWRFDVYSSPDTARSETELPDWNNLPLGRGRDTVQQHKAHHFLFAIRLARAQAYGAQANLELHRLIDSWMAATDGVPGASAYSSPLVAVHRAVALTWTSALLAGASDPDPALEVKILRIILADARFVYARLGASVPNNHLLADGFLMFYLGILYPEFREAERWRRDGEALFMRELRRQVYEDGTSFEHSTHYHELACEMVIAIVLLARRNGIALEPWVEERCKAMLRFQAILGGPQARSFAIGDGVETHLFPLDGFDGIGAASHREILRALYDEWTFASHAHAPGQERAAWLLGGRLVYSTATGEDNAPVAFPDGGFVVLPDAELNGSLVLRTGPVPGQPRSSGHMHADLLSVYLRLGGEPIIVDPGTYTYRAARERWSEGEPGWRAHFMGPAAHNTLCIENRDPLERGPGDFPSGPLESEVETRPLVSGGGVTWVEATVIGATPYGGHTRGVVHVHGHYWLMYDLLPAAAITERAWLSLHFAEHSEVRRRSTSAVIARLGDATLHVVCCPGHQEMRLLKASREPLAGWVSPRYGELRPAATCRLLTTGGPTATATLLRPTLVDADAPTVEVEKADDGACGIRIVFGRYMDYLILPRGAPARLFGVNFNGTALWLRTADGRPVALRGVALSKATSEALGLVVTSRRDPCDLSVAFEQDCDGWHTKGAADVDVVMR